VSEPLSEKLSRLGFGLAAQGTLAWLLWPKPNWQFEAEPAVAFGSAFAVWIATELRSAYRRTAHPHDIEFIRELRAMIPLDAIRYMQEQDFGATYDNERLDGFWHMDFDARAIGYGPHDKRLKKKFDDFRGKVNEISLLLASHGGPINASPRLASIIPDRERAADEFSEETWKLVRRVNGLADEVAQKYDLLMQESRSRVPQAFEPRP
jgi:hypothetical protein